MTDAVNKPALAFTRRNLPDGAREEVRPLADGWPLRRIAVPARGEAESRRGSILFMPGRGDCYEKWLEAIDQWAHEGWNVDSADWRGQGLSGRLGGDATTGHIDDFSTWVDDYAALWAEWQVARPGPHVALAHSMGGHIVLRALAEGRVKPDAVVLSAPMLGLHPTWLPSRVLHGAAKGMCALGDRMRPAWKGNEAPELLPHARSYLLTHDLTRFEDENWWRSQRPQLEMGAASWGWIERALTSILTLEVPGVLEGVNVQVLLLATRHDGLVSWPAIRRAAARLPRSELFSFGRECRHEILRETDAVRNRALEAIRDFLDRAAPARG